VVSEPAPVGGAATALAQLIIDVHDLPVVRERPEHNVEPQQTLPETAPLQPPTNAAAGNPGYVADNFETDRLRLGHKVAEQQFVRQRLGAGYIFAWRAVPR
jgi:hypothetical protein